MPNLCFNNTDLFFPSREIYDKFLSSINDKNWFMTFSPIESNLDPSGNVFWNVYTACSEWNTKWEALEIVINDLNTVDLSICLSYYTAWSPPTGVYEKMFSQFGINVSSCYYEDGMEYFGLCEYNKDIFKNDAYDYPKNKDELLELRNQIGINSVLDNFMESTWVELEDNWDEEQESVDFEI